jgi:hypothetical protein
MLCPNMGAVRHRSRSRYKDDVNATTSTQRYFCLLWPSFVSTVKFGTCLLLVRLYDPRHSAHQASSNPDNFIQASEGEQRHYRLSNHLLYLHSHLWTHSFRIRSSEERQVKWQVDQDLKVSHMRLRILKKNWATRLRISRKQFRAGRRRSKARARELNPPKGPRALSSRVAFGILRVLSRPLYRREC